MDSAPEPSLLQPESAEAWESAAQVRDAPRESAYPVRPLATRPTREALETPRGGRERERARAAETPGLVIGRIDVVVVSREAAAQPQAAENGRTERAFLSRNYLKRL